MPSGRRQFNGLGALHAITHAVVTVTNYTSINSGSVVTLLHKLAAQFTTLPITLVLDNARYQRNAYVMAEAERLKITLLWLPTYSPNLNLIERLWKFVKTDELCSEYWWCLHGRYYPKFAPFKQVMVDCLADPSGRHHAKLRTLLTLNSQVFKSSA